MAIDGYLKYKWRTEFQSINIHGEWKRVLFKTDDGGALYRVWRTFSFDADEFRERYKQEKFDGIMLQIRDSEKLQCNYKGNYYLTFEDLCKYRKERRTAFLKLHIPIQHWTKVMMDTKYQYHSSEDTEWASRLENNMLSGDLGGLADEEDVERYQEELAAGVYDNHRQVA